MIIPAENTTFIAGSEIYGRMDVICKGDGGSKGGKSELLIGELGVELIAYDGNLGISRLLKDRNKVRFRRVAPTMSSIHAIDSKVSNPF